MSQKRDLPSILIKCLVYAAFALMLINFFAIFIPYVEIYQPSYSEKNLLGTVEYGGWFTSSASLFKFIVPVFFSIPYLITAEGLLQKKENNSLFKLLSNKVDAPIGFKLLLAPIANLAFLYFSFNYLERKASVYEAHGGYCHFTAGGTLYIICAIALIAVLLALSILSKQMVCTQQETFEDIADKLENPESASVFPPESAEEDSES